MGQLIDFMILKGVNESTLVLLLMLPLIATLVGVARHIIGIKSFGIFTPVILSVAFASISNNPQTNLIYGLTITAVAIAGSVLMQYIMDVNKYKIFRLHYLPKLGIIMTAVAISLILMLLVAGSLDKNFAQIQPLPLFLIVTLVEDFITKSFKKGAKSALGITIETISLSLIGYFLIIFEPLRNLLLSHPELVLITIVINFIVGKFAGLRMKEYFRFTDIGTSEENA